MADPTIQFRDQIDKNKNDIEDVCKVFYKDLPWGINEVLLKPPDHFHIEYPIYSNNIGQPVLTQIVCHLLQNR